MRIACIGAVIACMMVPAFAQEKTTTGGPSDEKAKKTYEKAEQDVKDRKTEWALDNFKKADKQDGGHCYECQKQMIKYGVALGDWKTAEMGAEEMLAGAKGNKETTLAHYQYAVVLLDEGMQKHKDDLFSRAARGMRQGAGYLRELPRSGVSGWTIAGVSRAGRSSENEVCRIYKNDKGR